MTPHTEDPAWTDYRQRFADIYEDMNYDGSLQGWAMRASHRLAEKGVLCSAHRSRVLEVGAGPGVHASYVRHDFSEYTVMDSDDRALDMAKRRLGKDPRFHFRNDDGVRLPWPDGHFDRLIATHVLEHLYEPHRVLREWTRVVRDGGLLTVLIPTDPGLAWRLGRHLGPRRRALEQGIAYDYVMAREHVNSCHNLMAIIRHHWPARHEAWWPLRVPSIDLNLFVAVHATAGETQV